MKFIDFIDWFEETYFSANFYSSFLNYIGIRFCFSAHSHFWQSKTIFPYYPWKDSFLYLNQSKTID